jgi:FxLD family lantipeptide
VINVSLALYDDTLASPCLAQLDDLAEFELDVQVTTDAAAGYAQGSCQTDDTCAATCESACSSA